MDKKRTTKENQEQFLGKCNSCDYINKILIPKRLKTHLNYCMNCGSRLTYQRNQEN